LSIDNCQFTIHNYCAPEGGEAKFTVEMRISRSLDSAHRGDSGKRNRRRAGPDRANLLVLLTHARGGMRLRLDDLGTRCKSWVIKDTEELLIADF